MAVFCDLSNLERQVRASGSPPELFVLRRSIGDRACLALYWGLFPSRSAAQSARGTIPASLRAAGQSAVAVSEILPPGEPPPVRVAAAPAPRVEPAPLPPVAVAPPVAVVEHEPAPAPPAVVPAESAAPPVTSSPPLPSIPPPAPFRVPAVDLEVGYSPLWDDALTAGDQNAFFDLGWVLSACANLTPRFGVVGEASGHYDSGETLDVLGVPLSLDKDLLAVHAGPRYTHRSEGPAAPYVQALAGWTRTGLELGGVREVEDAFSIQPGVGLQLRLSRSVGLALGADYRLVFGEIENRNEFRLHAGIAFGIGDR